MEGKPYYLLGKCFWMSKTRAKPLAKRVSTVLLIEAPEREKEVLYLERISKYNSRGVAAKDCDVPVGLALYPHQPKQQTLWPPQAQVPSDPPSHPAL